MAEKFTTPGSLLIKSMLPTEAARDAYDTHRVLDKGGVSDLVANLIKNGGSNAHNTINTLSQTFFNKATDIGASTPLSDYDNDSEERFALIHEFEEQVRQINMSKKPEREKAHELAVLSSKIRGRLEKQNIDEMVSRGSTAAKMAKTGARGNPLQFGQGVASPLMAADVKGNPIPVAIKHSFAEGLSAAEHMAMSYGGRASTVLTQLSTALPGALFKKLTPNLFHEVITISDCGTKNGILAAVDDRKRVYGHYEAVTNRLIDDIYYRDLVHSGKKRITIRNTLTCEAKDGICQKCYGLAANGRLPEIGENMGVIASQSASEVLTQSMLSTKHKGGVAGTQRTSYELASNLLNNPRENFLDEATISEIDGPITDIKKTALGDHEVFVGAKSHFVPQQQSLSVRVGDKVEAGDRLSTGTINPRKLAEVKGHGAARMYLSHALRQVYGPKLDPRHFDLIAKNMLKYVEVMHPGESDLMPGQKMTVNDVEKHLRGSETKIPLSNAVGAILSRKVMELTPGTSLTSSHVDYLANHGVTDVPITKTGIVVRPLVPGLSTGKLLDKNWVSKMSFNKLRDVIREAGATGAESEIHSTDPITGYVMGSEFGLGTDGKY